MSIFEVLLNNTSSNSNMISQNPYSTPQAAYAKTSFPVSLPDIEWSTCSELILTSFAGNFTKKRHSSTGAFKALFHCKLIVWLFNNGDIDRWRLKSFEHVNIALESHFYYTRPVPTSSNSFTFSQNRSFCGKKLFSEVCFQKYFFETSIKIF